MSAASGGGLGVGLEQAGFEADMEDIPKILAGLARDTVKASGLSGSRVGAAVALGPPEGLPRLAPDEPPNPNMAPDVCDCVAYPLVAQFTWDSLSMLIEACKRERVQNWEVVRSFPEKQVGLGRYEGSERPDLLAQMRRQPPPPAEERDVVD
mmetsp:Transcript_34783/g.89952  ORF Transcript_34783/g.89952 Transcript_34783/m.89952 type:complete len:152 (+) Transcript_34783:71-526(+)